MKIKTDLNIKGSLPWNFFSSNYITNYQKQLTLFGQNRMSASSIIFRLLILLSLISLHWVPVTCHWWQKKCTKQIRYYILPSQTNYWTTASTGSLIMILYWFLCLYMSLSWYHFSNEWLSILECIIDSKQIHQRQRFTYNICEKIWYLTFG